MSGDSRTDSTQHLGHFHTYQDLHQIMSEHKFLHLQDLLLLQGFLICQKSYNLSLFSSPMSLAFSVSSSSSVLQVSSPQEYLYKDTCVSITSPFGSLYRSWSFRLRERSHFLNYLHCIRFDVGRVL